ncbi:sensor histidine kinase [Paenarthrobacter aurescens]|uniref:Oxygen sensor histidine kinase NreB n=1 Tax=Paenarthrobacter aurescens TaxID=43663 RepID=A0A4Y3NPH8_PAEAU|nr:sensor histidine kinase [Paenarthrobacter aurescens]MDO6145282.1 sensor histidine kinase [Paenarthrobacter aurescens]MDO6145949.1 sensor histidine kinase [Paenarthrobacter aurescens]MDO6157193.1 sensor histidine kinase [Paenarthrobacter aurescens]MDO6161178.1 sensor histidine kinase [Paenarthrobacter aurescens]GEB20918.1 two-component sensor histidine kinase [Paenarthrobacter aurescens]
MATAPLRPEPGNQPGNGTSSRIDGRIDVVVHLGFAVLMVASAVRYVMRHSPADNLWTVALAVAVCALYAVTAVLAHRQPRGQRTQQPWIPWMVALVAAWAALVVVAPSFAWCSFAIFFLTRTAFRGWAGYVAGGATAAATAVGLFRMSGWTDIAMLLGPLAAGALLTLIYDKIERDAALQRRLLDDVTQAQEQLAAKQREAGIATERERVSREIHDTVTQGLASSLLLLEAAQRSWPAETAHQDVRKATGLLRRNLADTRGLVHELSAPGLETGPLPEALEHAARQYVETIRVQVTGEPRNLPSEVRHALIRVTQSAVANIKLHAHAANASVTLGYLPDAVTLDVFDDGRGFDPATVPPASVNGGYGLRAMRQRVEQLGGVLSVESSPGEGTIIAAQFPLARVTDPENALKEAL